MPYTPIEESEYAGQPQEFILFTVGATEYSYASGDVEIIHDGTTYPTYDLETSDLTQSLEREQTEITITGSRDLPFAQLFVKMLPPSEIQVTIFRKHFGDSEVVAWWNGLVVGVNIKGNLAEIRCAPIINVYKRLGVRRLFQPLCNHMLYDPDTCRVDSNLYKFTGSVFEIGATTLKSAVFAAKPDGYFTAGFIRRVSNGDLRYVVRHVGDEVSLWYPFEDQPDFDQIDAYAGCDHSDETCEVKFNNLVNGGHWPLVPLTNPAAKRFA